MKVKSLNIWTTIISIIIGLLFTSQGIEVDLDPESIATAVTTKEGMALMLYLAMNLGTPLIKTIQRIRTKGYDWRAAILSSNLIAHLTTALALILSMWLDAETTGLIIGVVIQTGNYLYHRFGGKPLHTE
jgi:hypothetical protein